MRILLSNDDGIEAEGLAALEAALADLAEVWTVAPSREHSAQSHAFTLHKPLRLVEHGARRFSVSGTPADSVYVGLHGVLPERPDLMISGINRGSNLGWDVHYSGTVAAAREAAISGIPAVAVSLFVRRHSDEPHWDTAQEVVRQMLPAVLSAGLAPHTFVNVNVPNLPPQQLRGLRVARMGRRVYEPQVERRMDPRGRPYYWVGGRHLAFDDDPDTDGRLCEEGWATLTPMQADPTDHQRLAAFAAALRSGADHVA